MPLVSVIIPIYNSQRYLHECIDSVLGQSYTNFELLLINDGSTDNSGKICDEYTAKDSRVSVFHKENAGVSSARNLGIDNAKGEWITFLDSDDLITTNYFDCLQSNCNASDLILLDIHRLSNEKTTKFITFEQFNLARRDFMVKHQFFPHLSGPVAKFYKLSILRSNRILFDIRIQNYEDSLFNLEYIYKCNQISTRNIGHYLYRNTPQSLSKTWPGLVAIDHYLSRVATVLQTNELDEAIRTKYLSYPLNRYFFAILRSGLNVSEKKKLLKELIGKYKGEINKTFTQTKLIKLYSYLISLEQLNVLLLVSEVQNRIKT